MTQLSHDALVEFRDLWIHQPACTFAASIEELMEWDEQLYWAIQRGEVDGRASWAIAEAEAAERVANLIAAQVLTRLSKQPARTPLAADAELEPASPGQTASVIATVVAPSLAAQVERPAPAANDTAEGGATDQAPLPELVRARDVSMTAREWRGAIKRGELRASKVGREFMATRADYESYLAAKRVSPSMTTNRARSAKKDPATAAIERALAAGRLQAIPRSGRR